MKYKILHAEFDAELERSVELLLEHGWQLQGGVSVAQSEVRYEDQDGYTEHDTNRLFAQAMILP